MYVKAVAKFRKRLKKKRMARLEVPVRKDDVIRPPASPGQEQVTRAYCANIAALVKHRGAARRYRLWPRATSAGKLTCELSDRHHYYFRNPKGLPTRSERREMI